MPHYKQPQNGVHPLAFQGRNGFNTKTGSNTHASTHAGPSNINGNNISKYGNNHGSNGFLSPPHGNGGLLSHFQSPPSASSAKVPAFWVGDHKSNSSTIKALTSPIHSTTLANGWRNGSAAQQSYHHPYNHGNYQMHVASATAPELALPLSDNVKPLHSHPLPIATPSAQYSIASSSSDKNHLPIWNHQGSPGSASILSEDMQQSLVSSADEDSFSKKDYKGVFKTLKMKEKQGFLAALQFAKESLSTLPASGHWKLYLELAEISKRDESASRMTQQMYHHALHAKPTIPQVWIDFAKHEEESGNLQNCAMILRIGLHYCPNHENLLVKSIKLAEKTNNLNFARSILSDLKGEPVSKTWRVLLEGALMEARAGNNQVARAVFEFLMGEISHGLLFQEAALHEIRCENYEKAIEIADRGIQAVPKFAPLWFELMRTHEMRHNLSAARKILQRAVVSAIPKELKWKLYLESGQMEERAGFFDECHKMYVHAVAHCPANLLWKVWLAGARTELRKAWFPEYYDKLVEADMLPASQVGQRSAVARRLIERALRDVPEKKKAQVFLDSARLEEFSFNLKGAREILSRARLEAKHEWKVFLETVLLEMRANNWQAALAACKEALQVHTGTGRLWALLIHLEQINGVDAQLDVFRKALLEVPKSGEVWCEGARVHIAAGNWDTAKRFIDFAIHFTPQYGDSFIEYLRMEMLRVGPRHVDYRALEQTCINADPNYGTMWMYCKKNSLDSTRQVFRNARRIMLGRDPLSNKYVLSLDVNEHLQSYSHIIFNLEERWNAIFGV